MAALRLSIVGQELEAEPVEGSMKIAFASGDRKTVDQHFGSAVCFMMYQVSATGHEFVEAVRFPEEKHDGNEDKLTERIEALDGCAAVYVQAVGSSAIRRLLAMGVQPLKVRANMPIDEAMSGLKSEIAAQNTPWINRCVATCVAETPDSGKDPSRFDAMSTEEWDEG